jgi:threo-3-hydroxy-L-aspartate ammonia-lyase
MQPHYGDRVPVASDHGAGRDRLGSQDVVAAAGRIAGQAHCTPVLSSRLIDEQVGAHVVFKCENLQRAGAFKFRGAFNMLSQLDEVQRRTGVVAFSSGNHAQAVALAARELGIPATIVMPYDAPESKLAATKAYGATVVSYDRYAADREKIAFDLAEERGLALVPPFDHPHVIAGQGTAAKELFEDVGELDALFVPLGGGGLLSGTILAARELAPHCRVYGVEPAAGDDGQRSLREGRRVRIDTPRTIADGAQTQELGEYTFEIIRNGVTDILVVPDDDLVAAMRDLATYMKIMVEPTGALGFAGLRTAGRSGRVGVIISGGNVGVDRFAALMTETP